MRWIAFLRAINVGGHTVKMDVLRQIITERGFSNVETFIASGNVIFDAPSEPPNDVESMIATGLQTALGYPVATFIRTAHEVVEIAKYVPFEPFSSDAKLYVALCAEVLPKTAKNTLNAFETATDTFHIHQREVYWLCRTNQSGSTFSGAILEKALKIQATLRNITTIRKLAAKYPIQ